MRALKLVTAISIIAGMGASQIYTSPPPICFAFNDTGAVTSTSMVPVECVVGALTVHFTAPASAVVERIDLTGLVLGYLGPGGLTSIPTYELYATSSLGGSLLGAAIASLNDGWNSVLGPAAGTWDWIRLVPTTPVSLTGSTTYALLVRLLQPACYPSCLYVGFDPAGAQPLPYQLTSGSICPAAVPASGQLPFALRFRGTSCGPGPLANVTLLGNPPCLSVSPTNIYSTLPPVLGSAWFVSALGPYNETAYLFWSVGVIPAGLPIPGTACPLYLDPSSVQALSLLGAEPLASGTLSAPSSNHPGLGSAIWGFTVPASPAFAGAILGAQALVVGPSGSIPLGGGAFGWVTNALRLTLGY